MASSTEAPGSRARRRVGERRDRDVDVDAPLESAQRRARGVRPAPPLTLGTEEPAMKAAVFREFGGPEKVRVEEVPTPTAGSGEALIRVRACALNHLDLWVLGGLPALKTPLPFWTGCDIVGEVA